MRTKIKNLFYVFSKFINLKNGIIKILFALSTLGLINPNKFKCHTHNPHMDVVTKRSCTFLKVDIIYDFEHSSFCNMICSQIIVYSGTSQKLLRIKVTRRAGQK